MAATCVFDQITELPVCTLEGVSTARLHAILDRVSMYLESHHLAVHDPFDVPYRYRTDYLPAYVSGNDVVAVARIIREVEAREMLVPTVLVPLAPPPAERAPVTEADVEYLAGAADDVSLVLEGLLDDLVAYDALHTPDGRHSPLVLLGVIIGGLAAGFVIGRFMRREKMEHAEYVKEFPK